PYTPSHRRLSTAEAPSARLLACSVLRALAGRPDAAEAGADHGAVRALDQGAEAALLDERALAGAALLLVVDALALREGGEAPRVASDREELSVHPGLLVLGGWGRRPERSAPGPANHIAVRPDIEVFPAHEEDDADALDPAFGDQRDKLTRAG